MVIMDQNLIIQWLPNSIESFDVFEDTNKITEKDLHQTITLNKEVPSNATLMDIQTHYDYYGDQFFVQRYKHGEWETYEYAFRKSDYDYSLGRYSSQQIVFEKKMKFPQEEIQKITPFDGGFVI
jgi:hypothetical protein